MKIDAVSVYRVPLRLVAPLHTSSGSHTQRDVILVRVESDAHSGWGENVAPTDAFYVAESAELSLQVMIARNTPITAQTNFARTLVFCPVSNCLSNQNYVA